MNILMSVSPLILDTLVVCLFVLMLFFGIIKGIKNTLIDFFLFVVSLFLGFTSYTNSLKSISLKFINIVNIAPAGSEEAYKMMLTLFSNFVASLFLFISFYLFFHLTKFIINLIVAKKKKGNIKVKSKLGRVFSGIISFIYQGAFLVIVIFCIDNNFTGINDTIDKSYVTKLIVDNTTKLVDKIDEKGKEKLTIKVIKGDVFYKINNGLLDSYEYFEDRVELIFKDEDYIDILSNQKLTNDEVVFAIKERLIDMNKLTYFISYLDDFGTLKKEFSVLGEDWLTKMHRCITTRDIGKVDLEMNEYATIRSNLINIGLDEKFIALYDEITLGK